jgi:hypothetical protein
MEQYVKYQLFTPIILTTFELAIRRIIVPGQLGKKFSRPPSQWEKAECGGVRLLSQLWWKAYNRGSRSWLAWEQSKIYLQNNQNKKEWRSGSSSRVPA